MPERSGSRTGTAPPVAGRSRPAVVTATLADRRWRRRLRGRARAILAGLLLAALVVAAAWLVLFSSVLDTQHVRVTGAVTLSARQVRHVADVPLDGPLARVDVDAVRARVEQLSSVASVDVSRAWPHTITIALTERTPVAVVETGHGLRAVDASGVLFPAPPSRAHLPVVRAAAAADTVSLREAAHVAAALPARLARAVDHLELHSADGIRLVLRDGRVVVWGSAADSGTKARVAALLLRGKVTEVDVSVPARPTTR